MAQSVFLVMLSSIMLAGEMAQPGDLVEVTEAEAINFLNRKKARLATDDDGADGQLLDDGPTVEEFVAAGYPAANYPPKGYASRSTKEEIAAAIAAETEEPAA